MDETDGERHEETARSSSPRPSPAAFGPIQVPDHQLLRPVARGSYGEVWLARSALGTYRAVKVVHRQLFEEARPFEREFAGLLKFEPVSRSHPGLVDVLHVGRTEDGEAFYYVMELADDVRDGAVIHADRYSPKTLASLASERGRLPVRECINLAAALCEALQHLHEHGLIHRDIKPSNIIFVQDVPKFADIGLVAGIDDARSYVGTQGFMPPEGPGTVQADLFSLGRVLYEVSTGEDRQNFPALPTGLDKWNDEEEFLELNQVIVKACQEERAARYASARAMKEEVELLKAGKSVKRLRSLEFRFALLRRFAAPLIGLVLLLWVGQYLWERAREQEALLRQRQVGTEITQGTHAISEGNPLAALPAFIEALRLDEKSGGRERTHRLRIASTLALCPKLVQIWFLDSEMGAVEFSPDDRRLLTVQWLGRAQIWEVESGRPLSPQFGQVDLHDGSFSPDGELVITSGYDGTACVWTADQGELLLTLRHDENVNSAHFSPDQSLILTASDDNAAHLWEAKSGLLLRSLQGHGKGVLSARFSPDGTKVVTTSRDGTARIWRTSDGKPLSRALPHENWVYEVAFSPDGSVIVTSGFDRFVRVWDSETTALLLTHRGHQDCVPSVHISPDQRLLLSASWDFTVRLWELDSLHPLPFAQVLQQSSRIRDARFSRSGRQIATASNDGTVRVWDLAGGTVQPRRVPSLFHKWDGNYFVSITNRKVGLARDPFSSAMVWTIDAGREVVGARTDRTGHYLLTCLKTGQGRQSQQSLAVWDLQGDRRLGFVAPWNFSVEDTALSDDGRFVAAPDEQRVVMAEVRTGRRMTTPVVERALFSQVLFSHSAQHLFGVTDARVFAWVVASRQLAFKPLQHADPVKHVEASSDGLLLLTCCANDQLTERYARLWNCLTGEPVGRRLPHLDGVLHATFNPSGTGIVTAGEDARAVVWEVESGNPATAAMHHSGQVRHAAFDLSGQWLVTGSADHSARVWDASTGEPITPPLWHQTNVVQAAFLKDATEVVTVDKEGRMWVWDLPVETRPEEVLARLARLLTGERSWPAAEVQAHVETLRELWSELRFAHPQDFTVSPEEIQLWHQVMARDSETQKDWSAAIFHLRKLAALNPLNSALQSRLRRVHQLRTAEANGLPEVTREQELVEP